MDFQLNDEQTAVRELAERILGDRLPPERLREIEASDDWFAADVWDELAKAGLLGIPLPEDVGGGGLGILEACLVAEQVGRRVAPVPYLSSTAAALTVARHGDDEQRKRLLPGVADGSTVLSIGLHEHIDPVMLDVPTTAATQDGDGWRLDGAPAFVHAAGRASRVLVPARVGERDVGAFLVDPSDPGVTLVQNTAVNGEPVWTLHLDGAAVGSDDVLADGAAAIRFAHDHLVALLCAAQTGVCEEALALTARYVSEREQFGSKLGTFQAVAQRAADSYIDTEAIRLTSLQAAWRLSEGIDASDELLIAKFWAAEGAQRVVHAAQHLHGGVGMDTDHAVHRYFRWAKVLELTLGGASASLRQLGASLAARPVTA